MEKELIPRAKRGDHAAFDALIEAHRGTMFRYAYLIVRDATVADDITQDAVLRIYRAFQQFDESREFRSWALSITRNLARNHNRSWGRYKYAITRLVQGYKSRPVQDVEMLSHRQLQAEALHEAVSQLQDDFQDVIYARYFMGLSVEASATALEIAEGTVKSRAHRALKQLRRVIEQDFPQLVEDFEYVESI